MESSRASGRRRGLRLSGVAALVVIGLLVTAGGAASASTGRGAFHHPASSPPPARSVSCAAPTVAPTGPAVVSAALSADGRVLVVGSGPNSDCSLYYLTSDQPAANTYACTGSGQVGFQCAVDIWPALLTDGSPIAGPGVNPTLLGTVSRTDVLSGQTVEQVTYAGHPLYQFVGDKAPGQTNGEDLFDSFTSPPGIWYLVSPPRGLAAPGTAVLSAESAAVGTSTESILSATLVGDNPPTMPGPRQFPVYTFSADSGHESSCTSANVVSGNVCSVIWPPVLTRGRPQATGGLDAHGLGIIVRSDGSHQVTWDGEPLYYFVKDALASTPSGTATGNGLGSLFGGSGFHVVQLGD